VILGFDSATADTAVAVVDRGRTLFEAVEGPGPDGRPAAGRVLLSMIDEAVRVGGGWDRVATIAVGRGPGSFTGLRIAISTARALSQARRVPVAAVDSTAALADGLRETAAAPRIGVVDARRGEIFAAIDRGDGASEPVVCAAVDLADALGGDLADASAAGDGAVRFRTEIEALGCAIPADGDPANRMSAARICELAAKMEPGGARFPAGVTPKYMRRPDAERWLERDDRS
jgi:tRNA threonylcarbamoyladenosine biosynthesis protein TsaB